MIHNHYGTKDGRKKSRKRVAAGKRAWATRLERKRLKELMNAPSVLEQNLPSLRKRLKEAAQLPGLTTAQRLRILIAGVFDLLVDDGATSVTMKRDEVGEVTGHADGSTFLLTITRY